MFPLAVLYDDDGELWEGQDQRNSRLNAGVPGAHAVIPFQCEICWIRNLEKRDVNLVEDRRYLACIRRANLDAINSRAQSTIKGHVSFIKRAVANAAQINRTPFFAPRGPFPLCDEAGMGWAVDLLVNSIFAKGRISKNIQFGTFRKGRGTFTKTWQSSPLGLTEGNTFTGAGVQIRSTSCPSQSPWFNDFLLGAQDRMGYETKNQQAMPFMAVLRQLELIAQDIDDEDDVSQKAFLIRLGALIAILTAASLRGHEGFYLDITATMKHLRTGRDGVVPTGGVKRKVFTEKEASSLPEICLCLLGKFKGETGERYHSIVVANESMTGLKTRWWVERLMELCKQEGRSSGYAFKGADGKPISPSEYNAAVRHYIGLIQAEPEGLIPEKAELIRYGISRSYRKTSETRALRAGIAKGDVETMNRWRKIERAKGKMPQFAMVDHYSNAEQLKTLTWRYSYVL
jgi:hypothetical protein